MNAPSNQADRSTPHYQDLTLDLAVWLAAIAAAGAAPSIHNTQPWRFVVRPDLVELHLDPDRLLPVADPLGREARISCGAALLNLRITLRTHGIEPTASLLPQPTHPTLLAIVRPAARRHPTPTETALHRAIPRRHSHRRPFHTTPVPPAALRTVVYAAGTEGGYLRLITDPPTVSPIAAIIRRAEHLQRHDPAYQNELANWTFTTGQPRTDGVPEAASGPRPQPGDLLTIRDFAPHTTRPTRHYESDPLLGILMSAGDTPRDQLRSGQALQRALLTATDHGIGASIMSAPTELPPARDALRTLTGSAMWPQLVLRFGSAQPTTTTPRRPASDYVDLATDNDQAAS